MPVTLSQGEDGTLTVTYDGFRQGIDTRSSPIAVTPTHLPDAANVHLAGGNPVRIAGATLAVAGMITPDAAAPTLHAVHRNVNTDTNTHIFGCRNGQVYRWTGAAFVSLRRGLSTTADLWWSDKQISDSLIIANRTDGVYKYDGTRLLPIGAKHIFDAEIGEAVWAGGSAEAGATYIKQGTQSRKLTGTAGATDTATLTPATAWDLTTGILSALNGGVDYATSDYIDFWVYIDTAANLTLASTFIRFGDAGDTNYFQLAATGWGSLADGWNKVHVLKSAFAVTLAPNWNTIAKMTITIDSEPASTVNCWFDDGYMTYATNMPAVQIVTEWKGMLLGMRSTAEPAGIYYSIVGGPDVWDGNALFTIEPGDGTEITGSFTGYGDQLIVTKSNSVHPVSVRLTGEPYPDYLFSSPRRLTAEHGCDSHRAIVEGAGVYYLWWKGNIYRYRGVGTERLSYLFDAPADVAHGTTIASANNARGFQVVGGCLRSRNEIRYFYPTGASTTNDACLLLDYIENGAVPVTGQAMATATVLRDTAGEETLYTSTYAGRILEQDTGTTVDGTALGGSLTLPWTSAGGQHPVVSWFEVQIRYATETSGTLLVEYRTAWHPQAFDAATWVQADAVDLSASTEFGKIPLGEIAPWIQFRLRTTADPFTLYWPVTVEGMVVGEA